MIGMNFVAFATLFVISVIVSFVLHYLVRYRLGAGIEGFLGKVLVGWIGAWLGSPVLGHWPQNLVLGAVYPIPALLGSITAVFGSVLFFKTLSTIAGRISAPSVGREAESPRMHRDVA